MNRRQLIVSAAAAAVAPALPAPIARGGFVQPGSYLVGESGGAFVIGRNTGLRPLDVFFIGANGEIRSAQRTG